MTGGCLLFLLDSTDVLSFILTYESNALSPWRHIGNVLTNVIERTKSPAPTYLLFPDEFPRDSVLHIAFQGPVKDTQFLYSIYNANNKMQLGIKITPYNVHFVYDKRIDAAVSIRRSRTFSAKFNEKISYNLAILLANDQIEVTVNCGAVQTAELDQNLFDNFDLYGRMYLGADAEEEKQIHTKVS